MKETCLGEQRILVIGAGPVGALTALFLRQQGYAVSVYEKRQDPRQTDGRGGRSINLALANRGIAALTKAGVMARVWPLLLPLRGRMIHPLDQAEQEGLAEQEGESHLQRYGQTEKEVIYSVSRHALNVALVEALAETPSDEKSVSLFFGQTCLSLDLERGIAQFDSADHQHVVFDQVIGADGAGSVVRHAIQDAATRERDTSADGAITEAVANSVKAEMTPLGHGYKELTIPPLADGRPALAEDALHIWPRGNHMMIALPNQDASFTVTLFLPLQGEQSFEALRDDQTCEQFMQHYYAQAIKWMPEWAVEYSQNPVGQLATLRCTPWYYQDRALLIGDAAHAIVPFHGQGMNCGFEDCAVLAETIRQNAALGWAEVFKNFADIRKPSSDAIAQMAIENYTEMRASVVDPSFQLKKALGFELQRRFPGQFTPRYSMVMFGCMPYEVALAQGQRNEVLLNSLVQGKASLAEIDWVLAAELLEQQSCQSESNEGVLVS